jgi:hypothetical protein
MQMQTSIEFSFLPVQHFVIDVPMPRIPFAEGREFHKHHNERQINWQRRVQGMILRPESFRVDGVCTRETPFFSGLGSL